MTKRLAKRKLHLITKLCLAAALLVLLAGVGLSLKQHKDNQVVREPENTNGNTEPAPTTKKSSDDEFKKHQVAPYMPRYIFIPKISVRAMVKSVGVTGNNQIASPRNVFDVGWYIGSAKPGQSGATVMDGHISSWETKGVFYRLKDLEPGDTITLERGDGTNLAYKVVKSQAYEADKVDMTAALAPINPDKQGLNLISCTGKVIKGTNEFDKRIVIFAERVSP